MAMPTVTVESDAGGLTIKTYVDGALRRQCWTNDKRYPTRKQLAAERAYAIAGDASSFMVTRDGRAC